MGDFWEHTVISGNADIAAYIISYVRSFNQNFQKGDSDRLQESPLC